MRKPLLSVCLCTYNHAKYIKEAIDGVLKQKVSFSWEFIIADDCSTDGTREILSEYKDKHPSFIKLLLQEKNVGAHKNFEDLITTPKSKYIAYFDGDDYWTDPLKLQKQVDFLEKNEDYGLIFTDADLLFSDSGKIVKSFDRSRKKNIPKGDVFQRLMYSNPYKTCTCLFRRSAIDNFFKFMNGQQFMMGDYPLWLYISKFHKVGYLNESTSVYRILQNSAGHFNTYVEFKAFIESYNQIQRYFALKFNFNISTTKVFLGSLRAIAAYIIKNKKYKSYFKYLFRKK